MRRTEWVARGVVVCALVLVGNVALSQAPDKEQAALANALTGKHVALATGLAAASAKGKPISAKYEVEDGKLQLSVYTEKGGQFTEVIVNHRSGKVAKSEKITGGDDLKAAQAQSEAIAKATITAEAALRKALAANKGFSAVGLTAVLKDGKPTAEITLHKGSEFKTVTEPLA